jgi:hypothetical protein
MADVPALTLTDVLTRAARGVGKVDYHGLRGATMISRDEIEAMAALLAMLGLTALHPGDDLPADINTLLNPPLKDR